MCAYSFYVILRFFSLFTNS